MWGTPMLDLTGIALFTFAAAIPITQSGIKRFTTGWVIVCGLTIGAAVVLNTAQPYFLHRGTRIQFPAQAAATAIGKAWDAQTSGHPLKIVIGTNWLAGLLSAYHPDRPSVLIDGRMWKSPWISRQKLSQQGAVLIWQSTGLRSFLLDQYPGAVEQPELEFPYVTQASVPPARIGWAILLPD